MKKDERERRDNNPPAPFKKVGVPPLFIKLTDLVEGVVGFWVDEPQRINKLEDAGIFGDEGVEDDVIFAEC